MIYFLAFHGPWFTTHIAIHWIENENENGNIDNSDELNYFLNYFGRSMQNAMILSTVLACLCSENMLKYSISSIDANTYLEKTNTKQA